MHQKNLRKPFEYGKFVIEYRENKNSITKILKKKLVTFDEAVQEREKLLIAGNYEPVIKRVG